MQRPLSRRWLYILITALFLTVSGMANAADTLPRSGLLFPENAMKLIRTQGHIPGATLIPVQVLEQNLDKIPDGPVLLVCRTGHRAGNAWDIIRKARPQQDTLWYLKGTPVYHPDGTYEFI